MRKFWSICILHAGASNLYVLISQPSYPGNYVAHSVSDKPHDFIYQNSHVWKGWKMFELEMFMIISIACIWKSNSQDLWSTGELILQQAIRIPCLQESNLVIKIKCSMLGVSQEIFKVKICLFLKQQFE